MAPSLAVAAICALAGGAAAIQVVPHDGDPGDWAPGQRQASWLERAAPLRDVEARDLAAQTAASWEELRASAEDASRAEEPKASTNREEAKSQVQRAASAAERMEDAVSQLAALGEQAKLAQLGDSPTAASIAQFLREGAATEEALAAELRGLVGEEPWRRSGAGEPGDVCGGFEGPAWSAVQKAQQERRRAVEEGDVSQQVVVYRCTTEQSCGGLGAQLRGILSSFYWAHRAGAAFFIDWSRYRVGMDQLLAPNMMDWRKPPNLEELRPECAKLQRMFRLPNSTWSSEAGCTALWTQDHIDKKNADASGLGDFRPGCLFHFLFRPTPLLRKVAAQRLPSGLRSKQYVGVHVRLGDDKMLGRVAHNRWAEPLLRAALIIASGEEVEDFAGKARGHPAFSAFRRERLPIVVFADDLEVKLLATNASWLEKAGIARPIETTSSVGGGLFSPAHSGGFVRGKDASSIRQGLDAFYNALADLWGMSNAAGLVRGGSSMSRVAVEIGLLPQDAMVRIKSATWPKDTRPQQVMRDEGFSWHW